MHALGETAAGPEREDRPPRPSLDPRVLSRSARADADRQCHGRSRAGASSAHALEPDAGAPACELPTVFADDTLRHAAYGFAGQEWETAAVVERSDHGDVVGVITTQHLLAGRRRDLREEQIRERAIRRGPAIR